METIPRFESDDRVRFATLHLRNTGQFTGPEAPASVGPFAHGTVLDVAELHRGRQVVRVLWDNGTVTSALSTNLEMTPVR